MSSWVGFGCSRRGWDEVGLGGVVFGVVGGWCLEVSEWWCVVWAVGNLTRVSSWRSLLHGRSAVRTRWRRSESLTVDGRRKWTRTLNAVVRVLNAKSTK